MINVCSQCLRVNPLEAKKCHYCQGDCSEIKPFEYGQFLADHYKKEDQKVIKQSADWEQMYPDLKIFEDCRKMPDQFDLVIARP